MQNLKINQDGICPQAQFIESPNHDLREIDDINLIVIHNISLPPNNYGGEGVIDLFTNQLNTNDHPYYAEIAHLKVSSHFFIRRDGSLIQFVPCTKRAWHAGVSKWEGREKCNDFSIGIELEGSDFEAFEPKQYDTLKLLIESLKITYPIQSVVGHSDIAPGRKTDPGPYFNWNEIDA
ncbi:MAG: N-acetyl-anhydromuranmyl-L-alanine amidase, partial [Pseudomonadota bacterium]